jgi:hypothetical protein
MDSQEAPPDRASHTPAPLSPLPPGDSSPSPSHLPVVAWSAALVQLGSLGIIAIEGLPPSLRAAFDRDPEIRAIGWKVLAGLLVTIYGIASRTSLVDLATLARRFLPGGKS